MRTWKCCAVLLLWLGCVQAFPRDGRDFAGSYRLLSAVSRGASVNVTISVKLMNYGESEVSGARLVLKENNSQSSSLGAFSSTVSLAKRGQTELRGSFEVPREQYDLWQKGATPSFVVSYKDASGRPVERRVELVRMPPEVQQ